MTPEIDVEKTRLRKIFKQKRSALTIAEVSTKTQAINQNFIRNLLPKIYHKNSGEIFSIYLQSGNEVGTGLIASHFEKNRIKFSYPVITRENYHLDFILAEEEQVFVPSEFYSNVFEPTSGKKVLPKILIMPLLAFDSSLSRLGMGGGFFDRSIEFLKRKNDKIITIGLAYECQRSHDLIPMERKDQKINFVVTEKNIFSSSHIL